MGKQGPLSPERPGSRHGVGANLTVVVLGDGDAPFLGDQCLQLFRCKVGSDEAVGAVLRGDVIRVINFMESQDAVEILHGCQCDRHMGPPFYAV